MGYRKLVSWDTGDTSEAVATSGTVSVQTTYARNSGGALRANPTTTAVGYHEIRGHDANNGSPADLNIADTIYVRFWLYVRTAPSTGREPFFESWTSSAGDKFSVCLDSNRNLVAQAGGSVLLGGTGATVLSLDTWYCIELSHGSGLAGAWEVKINGTSEISGISFLDSNATQRVRVGKPFDITGETVDFVIDDLGIRDDAYLGQYSVFLMLPTGNGSAQTWTIGAGTGSHWQNVDELPHDSATTYLQSTLTAGNAETQGLETAASAGIGTTINCVQTSVVIASASSTTTVRFRTHSGGTNSDTATNATLSVDYLLYAKFNDTDPDTSAAWTQSGLDGLEVGAVQQGTVRRSRMTLCYATVEADPASSPIAGTLSATLGAVTLSSTANPTMQGALAATLGAVTLTATGNPTIQGAVSATLDALTLSAAGNPTIQGTAGITLGALNAESAATSGGEEGRPPDGGPIRWTEVRPRQQRKDRQERELMQRRREQQQRTKHNRGVSAALLTAVALLVD